MKRRAFQTAGPRHWANPNATRSPLLPGVRTAVSALLVLAFAARLASMFPGAPAPHWHGTVFAVTPGGAFPHPYGSEGCEAPGRGGDDSGEGSGGFPYYCGLHAPVESGIAAAPDHDALPARGDVMGGGGVPFGRLAPGIRDSRAPPAAEAPSWAPLFSRPKEFIRNQSCKGI